ncbi:uncharacterized protein LOC103131795 isoform X3 [Poecilia formosa]|uniref:uncharacterized protein LOC103131795 isoform X3 n=1 Tax=Poecilia formosa TaxID=48698 RepID=UPI0007B92B42|nr:PREDICTED: uncharacterized protein LOC103131795 isoform X3 [Poecilia formosa]
MNKDFKNISSLYQNQEIRVDPISSSLLYKIRTGSFSPSHCLKTPRRIMAQDKRVKFSLTVCLFLGASLFICSLAPTAAAFQLPRCQLINQTISLEKRGCSRCHRVETTICSGHCTTKVGGGVQNKKLEIKAMQRPLERIPTGRYCLAKHISMCAHMGNCTTRHLSFLTVCLELTLSSPTQLR